MVLEQPGHRVDGPLKVTGRATFAYEYGDAGPICYGFIVGSTVARGRVRRIETARAERSPGVRLVLTHLNVAPQETRDAPGTAEYWRVRPTMTSPEIRYYGEPVALVVAETFEDARAAASLVDVDYESVPGDFDLAAALHNAYVPDVVNGGGPGEASAGDFQAGFAAAAVRVDQTYRTPYLHAQPMEPHACLAVPRGDDLDVYTSAQIVDAARGSIAATLRMDPSRVRVIAPYVGGGFGSKIRVQAETILAALAARALNLPVKVALTRRQMAGLTGSRPASIQRIQLGAGDDGQLVAIAHDATMYTNRELRFAEQTATTTRSLYAAAHRWTRHRLTPLDLPPAEDIRAPGLAPGSLAVESAMDELAEALAMDPVELRIRNEPAVDPERGVPFSERRMVECLREGARRFGWASRPASPGTRREGRWLAGYGVAVGTRNHSQAPAKARVVLRADGCAVVQADMTDIGTGTYTILAQVAAAGLGLPVERVRVELGCSELPAGFGSGGSWGAGNTSTAVHRACATIRAMLIEKACGDTKSAFYGRSPQCAVFSNGKIQIGDVAEEIGECVRRTCPDGVRAEGATLPMRDEPCYTAYAIRTYGAHFAEVRVDVDTAEIRVRRMLGVFSAGRILNAATARSQLIGGMIWGLSAALHEEGVVDTRTGAFVNRDLAQYLVPVHADIPDIDAVLLDGYDDKANVLGAKGVGELGICGSGAAVANAVFNATGIRVRDFPITLEKLLPGLPPVAW